MPLTAGPQPQAAALASAALLGLEPIGREHGGEEASPQVADYDIEMLKFLIPHRRGAHMCAPRSAIGGPENN